MANTYSQLYVHVVFAVKKRERLISKSWKDDLYRYITGIITNKGQKLMIINGVSDHVHILIGYQPNCNLSDLVRDIKANSSKWVNENKFTKSRFQWQGGFGAFSIGQTRLPFLIQYIENQEQRHKYKSFEEEYKDFLKAYEIDFKDQYAID